MATRNPCPIVEPQPDENITPESFDEGDAFARSCGKMCPDRTVRNPGENLFHQRERLFHFANPDPDAGIDIPLLENRHREVELVVRRIGKRPARIETAPGCAPDIAPGAELKGESRRQ